MAMAARWPAGGRTSGRARALHAEGGGHGAAKARESDDVRRREADEVDERRDLSEGVDLVRRAPQPTVHRLRAEELEGVVDPVLALLAGFLGVSGLSVSCISIAAITALVVSCLKISYLK